jgi:MEMO1 family protein
MTGLPFDLSAGDLTRPAAVAGTFYPLDSAGLRHDVEQYISRGESAVSKTRLLISPHAGYVYSGPVAGKGYATIDKNTKRVIIIGPSHHQYFTGIHLPEAQYYQTPLGKVTIDQTIVNELGKSPMAVKIKGVDGPEHCLEVQLPFLQVLLSDFTLTPVIVSNVDAEKVADLLLPFIDDTTLVIASSDLSHYHEQSIARSTDDKSIATIISNVDGDIDGCGETPIRVIMALAKRMDLTAVKVDARTSFETAPQFGSQARVVGYASIAFRKKKADHQLSHELQHYLLKLARESLEASVNRKPLPSPDTITSVLKDNRGCFVTLTLNGSLRGCIGYIDPIKPLYCAVIENARNAALSDPRFSPVTAKDLNKIRIEVSVLTIPENLIYKDSNDLLGKLRSHVDGVILQNGPYQSTFLPQVWEQLPDKITFLEHLAMKGGMSRDGWKNANVKVYQAQHFEEGP